MFFGPLNFCIFKIGSLVALSDIQWLIQNNSLHIFIHLTGYSAVSFYFKLTQVQLLIQVATKNYKTF